MPTILPKNWHLLEEHSEFKGESELRVRVRKIKNTEKLIVDVTELSGGRMCDNRSALRLAQNRVRQFGIASMDSTTLCDYRADRKVAGREGAVALVKIRYCSYAFSGV